MVKVPSMVRKIIPRHLHKPSLKWSRNKLRYCRCSFKIKFSSSLNSRDAKVNNSWQRTVILRELTRLSPQLWETRPLRQCVPTATTHQLRITACARTTSQPGQPEEERSHAHRTRELRRNFSSTSRCTSNGGYVSSQWTPLHYTF